MNAKTVKALDGWKEQIKLVTFSRRKKSANDEAARLPGFLKKPRHEYKHLDYPTQRQHLFVHNFLVKGMKKWDAAIAAGYSAGPSGKKSNVKGIFKSKRLRKLMEDTLNDIRASDARTYDWKIRKLQEIAEMFAPSTAETYQDMPRASVAIDSIREMNKMEGHYAPERMISVTKTIDADIASTQAVIEDLTKKHEKEF